MDYLSASEIDIAFLAVGLLVTSLGLFSTVLKQRLYLTEPIVALAVGVLLSPAVLGWIDLAHWGNPDGILEQGARLAIAIQLMAVALRIPRRYPFKQWRTLAILLGLVMPLMWLTSGLLVYWILGVPFGVAMLIGAVLTPTDPVVSTAVVTGVIAERHLPPRIRHALATESAINDGMALPFVMLTILLLNRPLGDALSHWVFTTLLWEVGGAVVIGTLLGYGAGKLLVWSEVKATADKASFLTFTLGLTLLVLAGVSLAGSNGILAVFAAGLGLDWAVGAQERAEEENVQEVIDRFFTLYIFVLLGLSLPWQSWLALGWQGVGLAIAILAFRRLPAVLLVRPLLGQLQPLQDALFVGWFGPLGAAAVFYAFVALKETGLEQAWTVGSLVVCLSILVHGITAVPLTKLYGRQHSQ
ncbi:cation:proton antiporter [Nodosilinea sp. AN01ver1]|uniref:cation:proton antiporter domain-containing protein n=1 Tax=Nodosilinea sp. AN01ver1 TaxID=3423362 RepID=UPI003D31B470